MIPDPEKVRFWHARAEAYDRFCRRWELFSLLSSRLADLLPARLEGAVLDIGAGSGLTSGLLLARHPHCEVILIEPAEAMLDVARRRLAGRRAQFFAMGLDGAAVHELHGVAAIASVSMQFLDLDPALATLTRVVASGGHLAFNLWYHHWQETADRAGMVGWRAIAEAACREARLELAAATPPVPKVKTRAELLDACRRHGFALVSEHRDEDQAPVAMGVDYQAMGEDWPMQGLGPAARLVLLARMRELAQGQCETLVSTRFLLRKIS